MYPWFPSLNLSHADVLPVCPFIYIDCFHWHSSCHFSARNRKLSYKDFLSLACVDKMQWKVQHMVYDCEVQTVFSEMVCCNTRWFHSHEFWLCVKGIIVSSNQVINCKILSDSFNDGHPIHKSDYHSTSPVRCNKSPKSNVSHLVLIVSMQSVEARC